MALDLDVAHLGPTFQTYVNQIKPLGLVDGFVFVVPQGRQSNQLLVYNVLTEVALAQRDRPELSDMTKAGVEFERSLERQSLRARVTYLKPNSVQSLRNWAATRQVYLMELTLGELEEIITSQRTT